VNEATEVADLIHQAERRQGVDPAQASEPGDGARPDRAPGDLGQRLLETRLWPAVPR